MLFQFQTTDGFGYPQDRQHSLYLGLDGAYVDGNGSSRDWYSQQCVLGVSITYRSEIDQQRQHLWTYAAGLSLWANYTVFSHPILLETQQKHRMDNRVRVQPQESFLVVLLLLLLAPITTATLLMSMEALLVCKLFLHKYCYSHNSSTASVSILCHNSCTVAVNRLIVLIIIHCNVKDGACGTRCLMVKRRKRRAIRGLAVVWLHSLDT